MKTFIFTAKKIFLILSVWLYFIVRGNSRRVPQTVRKVLVVQTAKLGDMVCTTPIFRAIKKKYPSVEIYVLGNALNKDIVAYNKDISGYVVFTSILEIISRLKKERFDVAILAGGPDITSVAVTFLSNIPLIVTPKIINGHSPLYDRWYRLISLFTVVKLHTMGQYAPREYLRLLEPLGIFSDDTSKHLAYSQEAEKEAVTFLESNLVNKQGIIIGISPSAGNKIKNWGGKKFAELTTRLWKEYSANIIIIGGLRDREEVREMLNFIPSDIQIIDASENFSIDGLKALISKMDLFVSVDTGPLYIAEAFGVPTVDIIGPIDEQEQPPIGPKNLVIVPPPPRVPELHVMNARCYNKIEAMRQTDSITVDMVFDACKKIITLSK